MKKKPKCPYCLKPIERINVFKTITGGITINNLNAFVPDEKYKSYNKNIYYCSECDKELANNEYDLEELISPLSKFKDKEKREIKNIIAEAIPKLKNKNIFICLTQIMKLIREKNIRILYSQQEECTKIIMASLIKKFPLYQQKLIVPKKSTINMTREKNN